MSPLLPYLFLALLCSYGHPVVFLVNFLLLAAGYMVFRILWRPCDLDAVPSEIRPWIVMLLSYALLYAPPLVAMLLHVALRGALLAHGWMSRTMAAAVILTCLWRTHAGRAHADRRPPWRDWGRSGMRLPLLLFAGVFLFRQIQILPAFSLGLDNNVHLAWAGQLMNGEMLPHWSYRGIPNEYPWLHHAALAFYARLLHLDPLYVMFSVSQLGLFFFPVSIYVLAYAVTRHRQSALCAVLLTCLYGGMTETRLLQRDYFRTGNAYLSSLQYKDVMRPREITRVIYFAWAAMYCLWLDQAGWWRRFRPAHAREEAAAHAGRSRAWRLGLLLGLQALIHGNTFLAGMAFFSMASAAIFFSPVPAGHRRETVGMAVAVLAVAGLFHVPYFYHVFRYGKVATDPVEFAEVFLGLRDTLQSLGVVTPLALLGLFLIRKQGASPAILLLFTAHMACLGFGYWNHFSGLVQGMEAVFRVNKWYPLCYPVLCILSAMGVRAMMAARFRGRRLILPVLFVLLLGGAVPTMISVKMRLGHNMRHAPSHGRLAEKIRMRGHWREYTRGLTKTDTLLCPLAIGRPIWYATGLTLFYHERPRIGWRQWRIAPSQREREEIHHMIDVSDPALFQSAEVISRLRRVDMRDGRLYLALPESLGVDDGGQFHAMSARLRWDDRWYGLYRLRESHGRMHAPSGHAPGAPAS